jgi:hypothetical protein
MKAIKKIPEGGLAELQHKALERFNALKASYDESKTPSKSKQNLSLII